MFVDFSNFLNQQGILIVLATIMQEAIHHCQNNAFFQLVLDSQKNFHIHISILWRDVNPEIIPFKVIR